jgi:hypothetical protein
LSTFLYKNEYKNFRPIEVIIRRDKDRKENNRGDEPIWVAIPGNVIMKFPP